MRGACHVVITLAILLWTVAAGHADGARSAGPVSKLIALLEEHGVDTIATEDPAEEGRFVAAMYLPGSQLLAISAVHPDPDRMRRAIETGHYRPVYIDLHTVGATAGRIFIQDLQANGLRLTRAGTDPFDIVWKDGVQQTVYDGDWERQRIPQAVYQERFTDAEQRYVTLLQTLIAALHVKPIEGDQTPAFPTPHQLVP